MPARANFVLPKTHPAWDDLVVEEHEEVYELRLILQLYPCY